MNPADRYLDVTTMEGKALDFWTAMAAGHCFRVHEDLQGNEYMLICAKTDMRTAGAPLGWIGEPAPAWKMSSINQPWKPTEQWRTVGPLIERYQVSILRPSLGNGWQATHPRVADPIDHPSPLVAACRAIVASQFGVMLDSETALESPESRARQLGRDLSGGGR